MKNPAHTLEHYAKKTTQPIFTKFGGEAALAVEETPSFEW